MMTESCGRVNDMASLSGMFTIDKPQCRLAIDFD